MIPKATITELAKLVLNFTLFMYNIPGFCFMIIGAVTTFKTLSTFDPWIRGTEQEKHLFCDRLNKHGYHLLLYS